MATRAEETSGEGSPPMAEGAREIRAEGRKGEGGGGGGREDRGVTGASIFCPYDG